MKHARQAGLPDEPGGFSLHGLRRCLSPRNDPFETKRWYKNKQGGVDWEGHDRSRDPGAWGIRVRARTLGIPSLTDVFWKMGDSCDASDVNLAELAVRVYEINKSGL